MAAPSDLPRERRLPPRWLPLLYFGFAPAPIQRAVKLHFALGFLNLLGAAAAGLLLGLDKIFHVAQALVYLALAAGLGLALILSPPGAWKLPAIMVYGVLGLIGFLAQMVLGVSARLLQLFSWLTSYAGGGFRAVPPSPHAMPHRALQTWTLGLWSAGVPLLAAGLALDRIPWLAAAGWALCAAVVLDGIGAVRVIRCR